MSATVVALGAVGLSACSGDNALPETVRARVISQVEAETAPVDVEVTHADTVNRFRVERVGSTLRAIELSASTVGLVCRDRSERPETGCTVPVDP